MGYFNPASNSFCGSLMETVADFWSEGLQLGASVMDGFAAAQIVIQAKEVHSLPVPSIEWQRLIWSHFSLFLFISLVPTYQPLFSPFWWFITAEVSFQDNWTSYCSLCISLAVWAISFHVSPRWKCILVCSLDHCQYIQTWAEEIALERWSKRLCSIPSLANQLSILEIHEVCPGQGLLIFEMK